VRPITDESVVTPSSRAVTHLTTAQTSLRRAISWRPGVGLLDAGVVSIVAMVVFAVHGYDGVLNRDLGVFTYGGEQVARGVPPYVGIFNSVGPLADAVPGLAIWIGHQLGIDPVLATRCLFTLLSAGCCGLLCVLARDVFGSRLAGFIAPAVLLTFTRFSELATDGPREKTTMVFLLLAAFVLLGRRRWAAAGVATALATLTWQPSLLAPVVAVVALIVMDRRRWRGALRFVAGGACTAAAAVAFFWWAGALVPAIRGFVVVNLFYTHQPSALSNPDATLHLLLGAYNVAFPLGVIGLVTLFVAGLFANRIARSRRHFSRPVPWRLTAVAAGATAATCWTIAVINGAQDPFVVLPFASLGAAGLVVLGIDSLPRQGALAVGAGVVIICLGVAGWESVAGRDYQLLRQRADVAEVMAAEPHGASVLSLDAPQMLAIADRRDISSYQLFDTRMVSYLDQTVPGGIQGFIHRMDRRRPTVVVIGSSYEGHWAQSMLRAHYADVGLGPGWEWFVRRSVGRQALAAARAANSSVMMHHFYDFAPYVLGASDGRRGAASRPR
jgi:hypothetical protein